MSLSTLAVVLSTLAFTGEVWARPVSFCFTGEVTKVLNFGPTGSGLHEGAAVIGNYVFDSDAADADPLIGVGDFTSSGTPYGVHIEIQGVAPVDLSALRTIVQRPLSTPGTGYRVQSGPGSPFINSFYIGLLDANTYLLPDATLPTIPPDPLLFDFRGVNVDTEGPHGGFVSHVITPPGPGVDLWNVYFRVDSLYSCIDVLDPNPDLIADDGLITTSPAALLEADAFRQGVTADGFTPLVIRLQSVPASAVRFSIDGANSTATLGTLSPLSTDGDPSSTTPELQVPVHDPGGASYAVAVYRPPYILPPPTASRGVEPSAPIIVSVSVRSVPDDRIVAVASVHLVQVPVMLLHGLWDTSDRMAMLQKELDDLGIATNNVGYGPFGIGLGLDRPYDANQLFKSLVLERRLMLRRMRERLGIAASQIDVVAHSFGALVARAWERIPGYAYLNPDNLMRGDIRRLISVGAPHKGSRYADRYLQYQCVRDSLAQPDICPPCVDRGGVTDSATFSAAATLLNDGAGTLPIHTVVGLAPEGVLSFRQTTESFFRDTFDICDRCACSMGGDCTSDLGACAVSSVCDGGPMSHCADDADCPSDDCIMNPAVFTTFTNLHGESTHDLVVAGSSQSGGRNLNAATAKKIDDVVHGPPYNMFWFLPDEEMESDETIEHIVSVLRTGTGASFAPLP